MFPVIPVLKSLILRLIYFNRAGHFTNFEITKFKPLTLKLRIKALLWAIGIPNFM